MEAPKSYTTRLFVSESGLDGSWQEVDYRLEVGDTIGDVVEYTYNIDPTMATFIKIVNDNTTSHKTYLGITEVELFNGVTSYTPSNTALLEELTINGITYTENELKNKVINTTDTKISEISYKSKDNASVTLLPIKNNVQKICVISEDKTNETIYTVNLAISSTEDYKGKLTIVSAPEAEPGRNLEASNLVDGITGNDNHYHSKWGTNLGLSENNSQSIIIDSGEGNREISGFKYLPRFDAGPSSGRENGRVNGFKIYVSKENGNWGAPVYTGNFKNEQGWKEVKFAPKEGRYVRFEVTSSYGEGAQQNQFISGVEVNILVKKINTINENVKLSVFSNGNKFDENTTATLINDNETLRQNFDYTITYGAPKNGSVEATIKGIGTYSGSVTKTINVNESQIKEVKLLNNPYSFHAVGDVLDSRALEASLTNNKGEVTTVANNGNNNFNFDKQLFDTYLNKGEHETKVTVYGKEFKLMLNVSNTNIPNDNNDFINTYTLEDYQLLKYTTTSIDAYRASMKALNDLIVKESTSEAIYNAKKDVLSKINGLKLIGNTTNLEKLANENIDHTLYTSESYNNYITVVLKVKEALMNKKALSDEDITKLTLELTKAKEALKLVDKPTTPEPGEPSVPSTPTEKPANNLGYIIGLSVGIPTALLLGAGITILATKNKKKTE